MMGGQRTFELIPTSLVKSNGQRRPMTSKAAKKAYQQANRGPKISRAEQHRRDNAELEAQKKEYEKERAAAKAKAAREKRAAKADADREARRKQGLPEPSRFVRASQPTISRFVRNNNSSKRTWEQMENVAEDSDKTMSDTEKDNEGPPAKCRAVDEGSDDEFGEFPSLSQSDLLEKIDSSTLSVKNGGSGLGSLAKGHLPPQSRRREASQELPSMKETDLDAILNSQALDEMVTTQILSDLVEAVVKSDSIEPPERNSSQRQKEAKDTAPMSQPSPRRSGRVAQKVEKATSVLNTKRPSTVPVVEIPSKPVKIIQPPSATVQSPRKNGFKTPALQPTLQSRSFNMPPPRLPSKVSTATKSASTPQRPSFPSQNHINIVSKPLPNLAPPSTQAFLESHMDDFFPSPTQAVRELLDDSDDSPSNTKVAKELSPKKAEKDTLKDLFGTQDLLLWPKDLAEIITPRRSPPKDLDDLFGTQELILSPDDLAEIITPHHSPSKPLNETTSESLNRQGHRDRGLDPEATKDDFDNFMCTQDLILSPEDLEEICSLSRPPPPCPSQKRNSQSPTHQAHVQPRPTSREKRRFFQEKEEDLYYAAIQESKATSAQGHSKVQADTSASLGRNQSDSTDYGDLDFDLPGLFKEKEDEDVEAAIRESIITAELEAKMLALARTPGLNRVQSNSTDYGDFDLPRLFEEQEHDMQTRTTGTKAQEPKQSEDVTANKGKSRPRRFFEEKYEDQVYAAIHESKMLAAKKVPLKEDTEKPKRTLKRVLSTATDYGDDDFTGCSQELLDLMK